MTARLSVEPNDRITFGVAYEDEHVVVAAKPPGIVTTPGLGHESDSLLNALFARHGGRLQQLGAARDFGLLHRLDRQTSGLVLCALTRQSYDALRAQFESREVAKFYWAVVKGAPKREKGVVRLSIAEFRGKTAGDDATKKLAKVARAGAPAMTAYRILAPGTGCSLLECRAFTGRLHQVRVHLEAIGCPIFGDDFYAPAEVRSAAPRLMLHAHRVVFNHPATGGPVDCRSKMPADMRGVMKRVGIAWAGEETRHDGAEGARKKTG
ncbi:MAG TPA: RluA family pseudouridine synthase [Phycisphaerales bacterium]|nr:RluA family pseudouridine synthase [Phycisphaerales bacterium]